MQTTQSIEKQIRKLKQAKMASFVVCLGLLTLGMFEVGIVGRFVAVSGTYFGFVVIAASTIFMVTAGIAKDKIKKLEGV